MAPKYKFCLKHLDKRKLIQHIFGCGTLNLGYRIYLFNTTLFLELFKAVVEYLYFSLHVLVQWRGITCTRL